MNARFLVLGLMLAATAAAGANPSLGIKVSPAVSFAPANLVIRTSVDPDADNRVTGAGGRQRAISRTQARVVESGAAR